MESMEEIYQNHSKKVYTFLLSKTCNHELAEELTQETFFCAVNSINKFKGNSSVLTWLCGIAQNLWLKYLRDNSAIRTEFFTFLHNCIHIFGCDTISDFKKLCLISFFLFRQGSTLLFQGFQSVLHLF